MRREVWPLLLDRGVASDNLMHALRDTLQDTGLQVAEILPIVLQPAVDAVRSEQGYRIDSDRESAGVALL